MKPFFRDIANNLHFSANSLKQTVLFGRPLTDAPNPLPATPERLHGSIQSDGHNPRIKSHPVSLKRPCLTAHQSVAAKSHYLKFGTKMLAYLQKMS
jgi:hypothetical protein